MKFFVLLLVLSSSVAFADLESEYNTQSTGAGSISGCNSSNQKMQLCASAAYRLGVDLSEVAEALVKFLPRAGHIHHGQTCVGAEVYLKLKTGELLKSSTARAGDCLSSND